MLLPREPIAKPGDTSLLPAFPLYAVTPVSSNISVSAFNVGLSSNFASRHLIMSSLLVDLLPSDALQSLQASVYIYVGRVLPIAAGTIRV